MTDARTIRNRTRGGRVRMSAPKTDGPTGPGTGPADDLAGACKPRFLRLSGKFNVRGGIYTTVVVERRQNGWRAAPPVQLP